jgi:hypothetical protein
VSEQNATTSTFEVELDEKNFIAANWLVLRKRFLWKRAAILFAGIWLLYLVVFVLDDFRLYGWQPQWVPQRMIDSVIWGSGVFAILCVIMLIILPIKIRRIIKEAKRLAPVIRFEIGDQELRAENAISSSTVSWLMFKEWFENHTILVVALTRRERFIFPKSVVDDEKIAKIRSHLIAANVPNR